MQIYGTGGEMLKTLTLLLTHLDGLRQLSLHHLQLETWECGDFVDHVG